MGQYEEVLRDLEGLIPTLRDKEVPVEEPPIVPPISILPRQDSSVADLVKHVSQRAAELAAAAEAADEKTPRDKVLELAERVVRASDVADELRLKQRTIDDPSVAAAAGEALESAREAVIAAQDAHESVSVLAGNLRLEDSDTRNELEKMGLTARKLEEYVKLTSSLTPEQNALVKEFVQKLVDRVAKARVVTDKSLEVVDETKRRAEALNRTVGGGPDEIIDTTNQMIPEYPPVEVLEDDSGDESSDEFEAQQKGRLPHGLTPRAKPDEPDVRLDAVVPPQAGVSSADSITQTTSRLKHDGTQTSKKMLVNPRPAEDLTLVAFNAAAKEVSPVYEPSPKGTDILAFIAKSAATSGASDEMNEIDKERLQALQGDITAKLAEAKRLTQDFLDKAERQKTQVHEEYIKVLSQQDLTDQLFTQLSDKISEGAAATLTRDFSADMEKRNKEATRITTELVQRNLIPVMKMIAPLRHLKDLLKSTEEQSTNFFEHLSIDDMSPDFIEQNTGRPVQELHYYCNSLQSALHDLVDALNVEFEELVDKPDEASAFEGSLLESARRFKINLQHQPVDILYKRLAYESANNKVQDYKDVYNRRFISLVTRFEDSLKIGQFTALETLNNHLQRSPASFTEEPHSEMQKVKRAKPYQITEDGNVERVSIKK